VDTIPWNTPGWKLRRTPCACGFICDAIKRQQTSSDLMTSLHRCMHWRCVGSTGREGFPQLQLPSRSVTSTINYTDAIFFTVGSTDRTGPSSLDHHIISSMHRRLLLFSVGSTVMMTWSPSALTIAPVSTNSGASSVQPVACFLLNSSNSSLLWVLSSCFALLGLCTSSLGPANIHMTLWLVPLIMLPFNHQNHK